VHTHVLWGQRDPVAVGAIAQRLADEIAGAELTWLPQLGHYPMLEDPEAFARGLLRFVDRP
jgi:pimeloyl-ACP methyl ester carboxylesterase